MYLHRCQKKNQPRKKENQQLSPHEPRDNKPNFEARIDLQLVGFRLSIYSLTYNHNVQAGRRREMQLTEHSFVASCLRQTRTSLWCAFVWVEQSSTNELEEKVSKAYTFLITAGGTLGSLARL